MKQLAAIYLIKDLSKFSLVTTYKCSRATENDKRQLMRCFVIKNSRVNMSKMKTGIVRWYSLIRVFIVNILGSLSFFHVFIRCY